MKIKLLIIFILLFASFKAKAQEPIFIKNNYAVIFKIENNEIKEISDKIYYPTTVILDRQQKRITLEYSDNLALICDISEIEIPDDKSYVNIHGISQIGINVLFELFDDDRILFSSESSNEYHLFTKK